MREYIVLVNMYLLINQQSKKKLSKIDLELGMYGMIVVSTNKSK